MSTVITTQNVASNMANSSNTIIARKLNSTSEPSGVLQITSINNAIDTIHYSLGSINNTSNKEPYSLYVSV